VGQVRCFARGVRVVRWLTAGHKLGACDRVEAHRSLVVWVGRNSGHLRRVSGWGARRVEGAVAVVITAGGGRDGRSEPGEGVVRSRGGSDGRVGGG
jgi:hypothetical protein